LLDFNLAESPHSVDNAQLALHGGTLPYMAPEQIEAFMNPDLWNQVGARADVYSLGLVLRELLTGQKPAVPDRMLPPPRALRAALDSRPFLDVDVRRINPSIPPSLQAIVAKCLTLSQDDRYPDAAALERDLDRFLKYEPLKVAINSSRREQIKNLVVRNRRLLTGIACTALLSVMLYSVWHRGPAPVPKGPGIETSKEFLSAAADIAEQPDQAVIKLEKLEKMDRRNCVVTLYHSAACDGVARKEFEDGGSEAPDESVGKPFDDKNDLMREALRIPDAESTLLKWASTHKEVLDYLVEFAESRIVYADSWNEKLDRSNNPGSNGTMLDKERDPFVLRPNYGPARGALLIAAKLDPISPKIQRLLAATELVYAQGPSDYLAAHSRLSRAISAILADKSDAEENADELFFCRQLRSTLAFRCADEERRAGEVNDETVKRMSEAVDDLAMCTTYLNFNSFPDSNFKRYHNLHDRLRAIVTLSEVEIDLKYSQDCRTHLVSGLKALDRLVEHIESSGMKDKVPKTDDLDTRLERGCSRFLELDTATDARQNHGQDARTVVGTGLAGQ
jgi:hypothetical protein